METEGERLGPYRLTGRLGTGRRSTIHRGVDRHGREVAVKVLHAALAADPAARARLAREAAAQRAAARRDRHVPAVLDADLHAVRPYIVREHVAGRSLHEAVLRDGPYRDLLELATGSALALAAMHRARVVHGDLTPWHVLLGPYGTRFIDPRAARAGEAGGPAGDVYAWARCMVFAATGRLAYGPGDLAALPRPVRRVVVRCLHPDPARRPSADRIFQRLAADPPAAVVRRAAGVLAVAGLLLVLAAALTAQARQEPDPPFSGLARQPVPAQPTIVR